MTMTDSTDTSETDAQGENDFQFDEGEEEDAVEEFVERQASDVQANYNRLVEEFGADWVNQNLQNQLDSATEQAIMQLRSNMDGIKQQISQSQTASGPDSQA